MNSQQILSFDGLIKIARKSRDFSQIEKTINDTKILITYFSTLINHELMQNIFLPNLKVKDIDLKISTLKELQDLLPLEEMSITDDLKEIENKLYKGQVIVQIESDSSSFLLINLNNGLTGLRQFNDSENEFSVVGPKMGFVEDIDTNINLLRRKINSPKLVTEEIIIGSLSKTRVMIAYLDGITNVKYIETVKEKLNSIDFDIVWDTSTLDQIIRDNQNTPFPLYLSTERIDRITYAITSGQVAIFSDGTPYAISGPSTLLDFFTSPEDYYLNWVLGSFFRFIRIIGVIFSVFSSSIYIALLTFHYEMVPKALLGPIIESRADVPFPPFLEVIFLELTIELLREAGARLPTKVGQTLGIVGGIVIGQAAVAAALTSNILLIIVALSALASFTTPIFVISNTIRVLRFLFIILSSLFGGLGIMVGFVLILGHLFRLKSFGTPYLVPLFPLRSSVSDTIFRLPFKKNNTRPSYLHPQIHEKYKKYNNPKPRGDLNDE
ncbi:spore germination protein [Bacillus sp. AFS001701]|uniref:spore germination protein n=1 Tax=Bacillus sp. AFS001701 TaxID=2033480 RepID=UPI00256FBFBA|nr:spore germination protein [Bacillus sp. AFS001701]